MRPGPHQFSVCASAVESSLSRFAYGRRVSVANAPRARWSRDDVVGTIIVAFVTVALLVVLPLVLLLTNYGATPGSD
ncbi:MAG: hypothetical protein JWR63_1487 [Conexibacter sp.]|nr:hypothetical protein [Conexibacter sp.]